ncbi:MAG: tetratricopeptide repeat protein [Spirochaetes bacterium]|nr:tetratricopeptide repeat protein [Spirochaetota bacterium]
MFHSHTTRFGPWARAVFLPFSKGALIVAAIALLLAGCATAPEAVDNSAEIRDGWEKLGENRYSEAIGLFTEAAQTTESAEISRGLGLAYYALGRLPEAAEAFAEALRLDPGAPASAIVRSFINEEIPISAGYLKELEEIDRILISDRYPEWTRQSGLRSQLLLARTAFVDEIKMRQADNSLGIITEWNLLGPFQDPSGGGIDQPFIDEIAHRHGMAVGTGAVRKDGKVLNWLAKPEFSLDGWVQPSNFLGWDFFADFYASANLEISESGDYWIMLDLADAAVRCWIDGVELARTGARASGRNVLWVRTSLEKGAHSVLVKLGSGDEAAAFRFMVAVAATSQTHDKAAQAFIESIPGYRGMNGSPLLGQLTADFTARPGLDNAFWLSYALADSGQSEAAHAVAAGDFQAYGAERSNLAWWARFNARRSGGDIVRATQTIEHILFGAGFAPRDDFSVLSAILNEDWDRAKALADKTMEVNPNRFYSQLFKIVSGLGAGSMTVRDYEGFAVQYPGYPHLAGLIARLGGFSLPLSKILADMKQGDYVLAALATEHSIRIINDDYEGALASGLLLQKINPEDLEITLDNLKGQLFKKSIDYQKYIDSLAALTSTRPNDGQLWKVYGDAIEAWLMALRQAEAPPAELIDDLEKRFIECLEARQELAPQRFDLRWRLSELQKKATTDDLYLKIDPERIIEAFEDSDTAVEVDLTVVHREQNWVFFADRGTRRYYAEILKIGSRQGLAMASTRYMTYEMNGENLVLQRAITRKADGRRIEAWVNGNAISYHGLEIGDYLLLEYTADGARTGALAGEFWLDAWMASYTDYIYDSTFSILYPESENPAYLVHNLAEDKYAVSENKPLPGYSELVFSIKNLPPVMPTLPVADQRDQLPWLDLSSLRSWEPVAEWYRDLTAGAYTVTPVIHDKARELLEGIHTRKEAVSRIFDYVASDILYEDIDFQYSAFVPQNAESIIENGFGDCKDKTTLMIALLNAAGFEASYALSDPEYAGEIAFLPSTRFSHVITLLQIDGETVPLDTTASDYGYPDLPELLANTRILRIPLGNDTAPVELERLISNQTGPSVWLTLLTAGNDINRARTVAVFRGGDAAEIRSNAATRTGRLREAVLEATVNDTLPGFIADSLEYSAGNGSYSSPRLEATGTVPRFLKPGLGNQALKLTWLREVPDILVYAVRADKRDTPFELSAGAASVPLRQTFVINLPETARVASLPQSRSLRFRQAYAGFRYTQTAAGLIVERELYLPAMVVQPAEWTLFKQFVEQAWLAQSDSIILNY